MNQRIDAILFDLDGVLLDSKSAFYVTVHDFFKQHGLNPPTYPQVLRQIDKISLRQILLSLLPSNLRNPGFLELAAKEINYSYTHDFLPKFATEVRGSTRFVAELKDRQIRTGIITNGTSSMLNAYLRKFSVNVDIAFSSEDVKPKPSPEGILKALTILGVEGYKAIFCGDSTTDILAGRSAGTRTVGVLSGVGTRADLEKAGADLIVENVTHLKSILRDT